MIIHCILFSLFAIPHILFSNEERNNNNLPSNQPIQPIMIITTHSIKKPSDNNHDEDRTFSDYFELVKLSSEKIDKLEHQKERCKKLAYLFNALVGTELLITSIGRFTGTEHYLKIPLSIIKVIYWINLWEGCKSMIKIIKNEMEVECLQPYIKKLKNKLGPLKNE